MCDAVALDGILERPGDGLLPDHLVKVFRTVSSCKDCIGHGDSVWQHELAGIEKDEALVSLTVAAR